MSLRKVLPVLNYHTRYHFGFISSTLVVLRSTKEVPLSHTKSLQWQSVGSSHTAAPVAPAWHGGLSLTFTFPGCFLCNPSAHGFYWSSLRGVRGIKRRADRRDEPLAGGRLDRSAASHPHLHLRFRVPRKRPARARRARQAYADAAAPIGEIKCSHPTASTTVKSELPHWEMT